MEGGADMESAEEIGALLKTRRLGRRLTCLARVDSTNDFLKRLAETLPDGAAAAAPGPTAGRGRQGNRWASAEGRTAEFSVLLKSPREASAPPLTMLCGLAVCRALDALAPPVPGTSSDASGPDMSREPFCIKWPNDIVCAGKKICGILCEARLAPGLSATVCGIGVNLSQPAEFFEVAELPWGASVRMLRGAAPSAAQVVAGVLNELEPLLELRAEDAPGFFAAYAKRCVTLGRQVRVHTPSGELTGVAEALGPDGSLLLRRGGELAPVFAGDVSVRGLMGYTDRLTPGQSPGAVR